MGVAEQAEKMRVALMTTSFGSFTTGPNRRQDRPCPLYARKR